MVRNIGSSTYLLAAIAVIAVIGLQHAVLAAVQETVLTEAQIAELKAGTLNKSPDAVMINTLAYPRYLRQAADFSQLDRYRINFDDLFGRTMLRLYPRSRAFTYHATKNATFTVPTDYVHYEFRLNKVVVFGDDQVDALFTYKQAQAMVLYNDRGDFATRLLERVGSWANWQHLQELHLEVSKESLPQLQIRPFLERLPALRTLSFTFLRFNEREVKDALQGQATAAGWVRKDTRWKSMVQFYKMDY